MAGAVGRPRKNSPRRRGNTAREEILDAAAELFTKRGFATTSTHQIAEAVGIRQASLYYHFPSKTEIFLTLLSGTVEPARKLAERLAEVDASAQERLWALVAAESRLLYTTRWNVGRLYQLPIAASAEFADFREARDDLSQTFRDLAAIIVGDGDPRLDLPFHLAQSVTDMRPNNGQAPYTGKGIPEIAVVLADAALKVLDAELPKDRVPKTLDILSGLEDS
ncbi:TetR/AcrR family transcriptional regulator [Corynebacterium mendelii]|uniref:TetR/AcrR family transcriptional regulator n=1 Tax=Corynebacterium mendelii TaxID=2765362 RepID=A0A939E2W9_9CORY|nr:TetR/AcrR family transcriptional regulator [Corynebacterium mendelii]MBN9644701.1 TetR/AcrR family transcriptional regulator [Corynebacterium mendelii]